MTIWYQWEKSEDGWTEKNEKKGTFENLLSTLQKLLTKFLLHYFINKLQMEAYNACRLTATAADCNTAMVQMDFSENFSCVYQDEVSSTHWKTVSHCTLSQSGSGTKVYQWAFCQIATIMTRQWWYLTLRMFSTTSKNTLETMFMIMRSGLMDHPVSLRINTSLGLLASPYLSW